MHMWLGAITTAPGHSAVLWERMGLMADHDMAVHAGEMPPISIHGTATINITVGGSAPDLTNLERKLDAFMANIDQATTDLAASVQAIGQAQVDATARVTASLGGLKAAIDADVVDKAALKTAADNIEAQVAHINTTAQALVSLDVTAPTPPPPPPPAPVPAPTPPPATGGGTPAPPTGGTTPTTGTDTGGGTSTPPA